MGRLRHPARGKPAHHNSRTAYHNSKPAHYNSRTAHQKSKATHHNSSPAASITVNVSLEVLLRNLLVLTTGTNAVYGRVQFADQRGEQALCLEQVLCGEQDFVVSGLAPRWVAEPPQIQTPQFQLKVCTVSNGAASPPSAGQARSPQKQNCSPQKQALSLQQQDCSPQKQARSLQLQDCSSKKQGYSPQQQPRCINHRKCQP
ncbi:hypothetical protein BW43_01413 [Pseudomonas sp. RIT357]|nr:hypothetical protein BW43_01413 [Pseudomonas sp. RIT357]